MDQNSLPMVLDLSTFPRPIRLAFLWGTVLFVALFVGPVLLGLLTARGPGTRPSTA